MVTGSLLMLLNSLDVSFAEVSPMLIEGDRQKLRLYDAQLCALDALDLPQAEIQALREPLLAARAAVLSRGAAVLNRSLFVEAGAYGVGDEEVSTDLDDDSASSPPGSQG